MKKVNKWIVGLASLALVGGLFTISPPAFAQSGAVTGSFVERDFVARGRVTYYDVATSAHASQSGYGGAGVSGGAGDSILRLVNTELTPPTITGTGTSGEDDCAMIYVFDDAQELEECCGCPLSANGMRTLSVIVDLTSNPVNARSDLAAGDIKIVAANPNGSPTATPFGICNPAVRYDLEPGVIDGWITHTESIASNLPPGYSFVPTSGVHALTDFAASVWGLKDLVELCNSNVANGTGVGVCTCGKGS